MPITTLPALSRTATTFKADVDTFFGTQLPAFATEANALESNVNAKEASAVSSATTATTKAGEASASAAAALDSKNSASASATTATTKAGEASASAASASDSATTATTKAAEAAASAASVVRDGSGGVAGLTLFKLNLKNAAGTITSWFTTAATAARTWTMPDKDGTVAMTSDFAAPGPIGGTTPAAGSFTTLSASGATTLGSATPAGIGAGEMGLPNSAALRWRNAANSAYLNAMYVDSSNNLIFGGSAVASVKLSVAGTGTIANATATGLAVTGVVTSEADNTRTLGTASLRWSTVYAGTGTINTSDAREKTPVRGMTANEINAAKALSAEIGAYKFLDVVAAKGAAAREHIGMTVQRVIEIMTANGLDPFNYGFVCYDAWGGGDRYAFRMDELLMFIARGFGARLAALEAA